MADSREQPVSGGDQREDVSSMFAELISAYVLQLIHPACSGFEVKITSMKDRFFQHSTTICAEHQSWHKMLFLKTRIRARPVCACPETRWAMLPCVSSLWSLPGRRWYVPLCCWQPQQSDGQKGCLIWFLLPQESGWPWGWGCGRSRRGRHPGYSSSAGTGEKISLQSVFKQNTNKEQIKCKLLS